MKIAFIHIGKTGGTTIYHLLHNLFYNNIDKHEYVAYHLEKNYENDEYYIIWIRNPIGRFVSAFNQSYYGIHTNIKTIDSFDIEHCLIPNKMKKSMNQPYIFSREYDLLMREFQSANELAESLTSVDETKREKAIRLMNREEEHIFKNIGWYLNNGDFLKNKKDKILFVGKTETMKEDIIQLSDILGKCIKKNVNFDSNIKLRENIYIDKSMKYLSPLAIQNIINWYKNTDYKTLKQLVDDGWIDQSTFDSYHTYNI